MPDIEGPFTPEEAYRILAAQTTHLFYTATFAKAVQEAFGMTPITQWAENQPHVPGGLNIPGVASGVKVEGYASHDLACAIADHLGLTYSKGRSRGQNQRAALQEIGEFLSRKGPRPTRATRAPVSSAMRMSARRKWPKLRRPRDIPSTVWNDFRQQLDRYSDEYLATLLTHFDNAVTEQASMSEESVPPRRLAALKAWKTMRGPVWKAGRSARLSKSALKAWAKKSGFGLVFLDARSGHPRTGIIDAVLVRIKPRASDELELYAVQLKGGKAGFTAAEGARLRAAAKAIRASPLVALHDGQHIQFLDPSSLHTSRP